MNIAKRFLWRCLVVALLTSSFVVAPGSPLVGTAAAWSCTPPEPYVDYDPETEPWYPWVWWNWRTSESGVAECGSV